MYGHKGFMYLRAGAYKSKRQAEHVQKASSQAGRESRSYKRHVVICKRDSCSISYPAPWRVLCSSLKNGAWLVLLDRVTLIRGRTSAQWQWDLAILGTYSPKYRTQVEEEGEVSLPSSWSVRLNDYSSESSQSSHISGPDDGSKGSSSDEQR